MYTMIQLDTSKDPTRCSPRFVMRPFGRNLSLGAPQVHVKAKCLGMFGATFPSLAACRSTFVFIHAFKKRKKKLGFPSLMQETQYSEDICYIINFI